MGVETGEHQPPVERPASCPICDSRFPHVCCFLGWAGEAGPCDNDWHYPNGRAEFGRSTSDG